MKTPKQPGKPGRPKAEGGGYEKRIAHYENEGGKRLLADLCRLRGGISATALLRQLTREEAQRKGLDTEGAE